MKRIGILFIILALGMGSCNNEAKDLGKYSWLLGTWKSTKGTPLYEYWESVDDTMFVGIGFRLFGNDTVVSENLKIYTFNDVIHYSATVPSQNSGRTIRFKMVSKTTDTLVFENPDHDYPNRISYFRTGENKMTTMIEGFGRKKSVRVGLKKIH